MTSSIQRLLSIFSILLQLISTIFAAPSQRPKDLLFRVYQDSSTLQYVVRTTQRTPLKSIPLTLVLGNEFSWVDCDKGYISSTYKPARCMSVQCSLAGSTACGASSSPHRPGCSNDTTYGLSPNNPFTNTATSGELASDVIKISSTDGVNVGRAVSTPNFLFNCAPTFLLKGLAKGVQGIAGFGRSKLSIPSQITSIFSLTKKFSLCLWAMGSPADPILDPPGGGYGVIFFGNGPYRIYPSLDATAGLSYTPLLTNPTSPYDYYIGVKSIRIGNTSVAINKALLSINNKGEGGTKISTIHPYTILESSIFKAVTTYFDKELREYYSKFGNPYNATRVKAVAPFGICYDRGSLLFSRPGVQVPRINLVLQNKKVQWGIDGYNSMVKVNDNVMCVAFVDGGKKPTTSIVLGGYQLQNNFLQFDLAKSRVGFRFLFDSVCSNFFSNF